MGVVLLIMMVYVGVVVEVAATGMKPEKKPVVLVCSAIGWHGWSKVDCVTVWFAGANWNWTMSPLAATRLLGKYARVPFAEPTRTTCTVTEPDVPVAAAAATPELDAVEEVFAGSVSVVLLM